MSTNGMSDWAVDLADVAAVYPFQGTEFPLFILGLVFWIGWHVLQFRSEKSEVEHEMHSDETGEKTKEIIGRY